MGMSTIGAVAGVAALVVSILAYLRTGRSRPFALRLSARPLGAAAVLVAAAATAGALYASEASQATSSKPAAEPVWWRIQHVPSGKASAAEAPLKPATLPPVAKGKIVRKTIVVENRTIS